MAKKPVYVPKAKTKKVAEAPQNTLDAEPQQKVDKRSVSWIKPGQTLNPGGRPKGSRNRLQGDFMWELAESFAKHGKSAIEAVIKDKPHEFLKICESLMPKEVEVTTTVLDEMSLEQLEESLATLKRLQASGDVTDVEIKSI